MYIHENNISIVLHAKKFKSLLYLKEKKCTFDFFLIEIIENTNMLQHFKPDLAIAETYSGNFIRHEEKIVQF